MESAQSIERKFLGQDNHNLTDKFAKSHERDALWPGFRRTLFFFALCCLGKVPGGAPFSQLHKSGNGSRVDRP